MSIVAPWIPDRDAGAEVYVVTRDTDLRKRGIAAQQHFTVVTKNTDLRGLEIARVEQRLQDQSQADAVRRLDAQIDDVRLTADFWQRQVAEFQKFNRHFVDSKPFNGYEEQARLEMSLARIRLADLEADRRRLSDPRDVRRLRNLTSPRVQ